MFPAATVALFRQQRRHLPTAAKARRSIASATRPSLLWMRQEEEMRLLEEERRQQEEERERERQQEGLPLALPGPGAKEGVEGKGGERPDAGTEGAETPSNSTGTEDERHQAAFAEEGADVPVTDRNPQNASN